MLQEEFEERTGLELSESEFAKIHAIYMACGDTIDKDLFCKYYMNKDGRLELLRMVTDEKTISDNAHDMAMKDWTKEKEQAKAQQYELAEFLIGKACAYSDTDFQKEAVRLIGLKEVVLMKIRMGLPLWEEEQVYINNNLK